MLLNRTSFQLAIGVLISLAGAVALGQDLEGFQLFAPAEVRPYGGGPRPKEGYFFVFDGLIWSISAPDATPIGNGTPGQNTRIVYDVLPGTFPTGSPPTPVGWTQSNTHTTGGLRAAFKEGNRFELGRVVDGHGWMLGAYRLTNQTQKLELSHVGVVFADDDDWGSPSGGRLEGPIYLVTDGVDTFASDDWFPLPVIYDTMRVQNRVEHWSVELMYICRPRACHYGGVMEFFAGARYMALDDKFSVETAESEALAAAVTPVGREAIPSTLADSYWMNNAENHIVGPQVGARWFKKSGRWMISTEGRFLAGINYQNIRQRGVLGTKLNEPRATAQDDLGRPALMLPTDFEHAAHTEEWSPAIELRVDWRYQLSRAISLRAGWTGMWVDGIARGSNMIDYSLREDSVMGILMDNNRQEVFVHGLTLGVDVNR